MGLASGNAWAPTSFLALRGEIGGTLKQIVSPARPIGWVARSEQQPGQ